MAHGDAREEKWRGNKRMEWVTSKRHLTAEHRLARAVQTLQAAVCTARLPVVDWTDAPARLNGLVHFLERRILVSARVASHFKRSLPRSGCPMYATPVHDIKAYKRDTGRAPLIVNPSEWMTGHDYWYQIRVVVIWAMTPCWLVGRYQHIEAILYPWTVFNVLGCFKAESRTLTAPSCTAEWTGMKWEGLVRKRSCTNRGTIPEFEWMYRERPRRNPVR